MAALQSTGAMSIGDIAGVMGGSTPHSLSEYYRGGGLVPITKTTQTREPTSGFYYNAGNLWYGANGDPNAPYYFWLDNPSSNYIYINWNTGGPGFITGAGLLSYVWEGSTYYRGNLVQTKPTENVYNIYRITSTLSPINIYVPASGAISMSSFYSAEKP